MTASVRFKGWVDDRAKDWGGQLGAWLLKNIANGITKSLEDQEPGVIEQTRATIQALIDNPQMPPAYKEMLKMSLAQGNIFHVLMGWVLSVIGVIFAIFGLGKPVGNILEHMQELALRSQLIDPMTAIQLWRRDPAKYGKYLEDLQYGGFDDERIEALKFVTQLIPGVQDLIRMSVREAFSPEIAEKFGQYQDPPTAVYPWAEKLGLSQEWVDRYWAAHWELPSSLNGFELLHRGIITEDELKLLLRALDVMPFWRDKLIKLSWNIPTRVDVRRFWDLRTIDEARLREVYTGMGYHAQDLEDYVLWTKIYVEFPDLLARFKNGWISLEQVRSRLLELGMKPDAAEELLQTKVQAEGAARSNAERDLTLTDIYKGVKMERVTRAEAVGLIMDLGYSEDEAGFKLDVNVPTDETTSAVEQRQLAKADVLSGLKAGIITREGARQMLLQLRYAAVDVEFLLKLYDAQIKPPTEVKLLEASKADIVLGVKKGLITQSEGHAMLLDIGYAPAAADFILTVQTTESPFSPVNFDEFKDRTQKWRLAAGMEGKPMTEEIKKLGADVVRISAEVTALARTISEEQGKLVSDTVIPAEATARVKELQATLYKAQAELARVKTDYNAKIAEWKHAAK